MCASTGNTGAAWDGRGAPASWATRPLAASASPSSVDDGGGVVSSPEYVPLRVQHEAHDQARPQHAGRAPPRVSSGACRERTTNTKPSKWSCSSSVSASGVSGGQSPTTKSKTRSAALSRRLQARSAACGSSGRCRAAPPDRAPRSRRRVAQHRHVALALEELRDAHRGPAEPELAIRRGPLQVELEVAARAGAARPRAPARGRARRSWRLRPGRSPRRRPGAGACRGRAPARASASARRLAP